MHSVFVYKSDVVVGAFELDITIENNYVFDYALWWTIYILQFFIYCIQAID